MQCKLSTLLHDTIAKIRIIIPLELFFEFFEGSCALKISGKERLFQGISREILKHSEIIALE